MSWVERDSFLFLLQCLRLGHVLYEGFVVVAQCQHYKGYEVISLGIAEFLEELVKFAGFILDFFLFYESAQFFILFHLLRKEFCIPLVARVASVSFPPNYLFEIIYRLSLFPL